MAKNNPSSVGRLEGRGGFLTTYKPGQGRYTRLGTAAAGGVLALAGANYLYDKLSVMRDLDLAWTLWVQAGVPVLAMALTGLLIYWLVGRHQKVCDFMISTEGEMKKVSWSTKREVIGSTKVVITLVAMLAVMLFVVDATFAMFFNSIHVLKVFALKDLLG